MRSAVIPLLLTIGAALGQTWGVRNHVNNGRKAIISDSILISDYVFSEVSDLSEGKAYVSQGELYAYIDKNGKELTPYVFAVATNFTNGYALVGDSFNLSVLNDKMQLIIPFAYQRAKLPVHGLIVVQSWAGTWGIFDVLGTQKVPFIYDLPPHILSKDKIIVRLNEDYGVINDCHEYLFKCNFQYISPDGFGYKRGKYLRLFYD
jgi:hypothetical protein